MRKFLAFDIGGTLIKFGVLTEDGTIIEKFEIETEAYLGGPVILEKIKQHGKPLVDQYKVDGICISTAGQVHSDKGEILFASDHIPDYTGTRLKEEFESFFNLPVEVENDVNCAGLAESWIGTGKNAKSVFCLTIGTGIGGSYILDNKLHTGHNFSGGEIGYIPIEGGRFEDLASTRILVRNVALQKGLKETDLNGKAIFELAKNGDGIAIKEIEQLIVHLCKGIATIAYMMNPEMIIIGGGITAQKDYLYPLIMKELKKEMIPSILDKTKIEIAHNLNNAGMIGAVRHFLLQESMKPLKSITAMIESNQHKLTKREQMIARYITLNLESVPNKTISEMSRQINVSEATITRFCQKLEFGSYNKLRLLAKEATVSTRRYDQGETTSLTEVKQTYAAMLKKFDSFDQTPEIIELKTNLIEARQLFFYGEDEMSIVAQQLKYKWMKMGKVADACTTSFQMNASSSIVNHKTVVIGLNTSGYASETVKHMAQAKQAGAFTVGISSQQDSPLSHAADIHLLIPGIDDLDENSHSINEVSVYYLLDIIAREIQSGKESLTTFSSVK
ncbi:ROK family protein [Jeotgalibacillus campisalis]|uniref:Putative glucose kinase n=1 Tax=Jeotgalibacillus campisalis TaxID=220754 RepID=A0A0C2VEX6_9BACL|nr:ROK family protein [Jeotgalibacillus campisalis]KIL43066.1 putative glucose kinase [Jeotgalibacillus campisalis]